VADVICLGILVADVVAKPVAEYPGRGRLVLVEQMELHSGGCAANTGIALARLGVATSVIGKVGRDSFGDFVVGELERHGVDASGVLRDDQAQTAATMVMVHPDAERSFVHCAGANATLTAAEIDTERFRGARFLHVAGSLLMPAFDGEPTAEVLRRAREMGLVTSLDTVWDSRGRWMAAIRPCLPHLDLCMPSIEEARELTGRDAPGEVAAALAGEGARTVVLKMGEAGCYVRSPEGEFALPAFAVDAVDALGAGDCFAAGFLAGRLRGWDLARAARFACAVGAMCVTALGATAGVGGFERTLEFERVSRTRSEASRR
jgi:sugar/nucleoside kinase (ribokinase family)